MIKKTAYKRKNLCKFKILVLLNIIVIIFVVFYLYWHNVYGDKKFLNYNQIVEDGYYPVKEVLELDGYTDCENYLFNKNNCGKEIIVDFDFDGEVCNKNLYQFSLQDKVFKLDEEYFVKKECLESILNINLDFENGKIRIAPITYKQHDWTLFTPLIAHAGGTVREKTYNSYYTNSLEALVTNYNLGHRIFEFDFYLTSDQKLAAVHDWEQFGNKDGIALSSEEWKNYKTFAMPFTEGLYTTLLIEDILDEMLVNKDIFIVTDTKLTEVSDESKMQFQLIYDEAMKRSPELLNRVIPQIYNEEMYDMVMSVYDFPSIIYTAYAAPYSSVDIIEFANKYNNIKVITAPVGDVRFDEAAVNTIHQYGMLLFNHTIQSYEELTEGKARGVDGFYSGLLLPKDFTVYQGVKTQ